MILSIRNWWLNLSLRERWLLIMAGAGAAVMLFYGLVWQPLLDERNNLRLSVEEKHQTVAIMQNELVQIRKLQKNKIPSRSRQSLLTLVDRQLRRNPRLGGSIKRLEPQGNQRLIVRLENVNFVVLMSLLTELTDRSAIAVEAFSATRRSQGRVDSRVILSRGQT